VKAERYCERKCLFVGLRQTAVGERAVPDAVESHLHLELQPDGKAHNAKDEAFLV